MLKSIKKYTAIILSLVLFSLHIPIITVTAAKTISINEYIIILNKDANLNQLNKYINSLDNNIIIKSTINDYMLINVENCNNTINIINLLMQNNNVSLIQPNFTYQSKYIYNDEYLKWQWGIYDVTDDVFSTFKWSKNNLEDVNLDIAKAWESYESQNEVIVAVLDTGIDYSHEDLKDRMWINTNEIQDNNIDDDQNGFIDDYYGWDFYNEDSTVCHYSWNPKRRTYTANLRDSDNHGTHVAGIIAASGNNNIGIAGVASNINVKIMAIKISGGIHSTGSTFDAICGIQYANSMGAKICNMSWGNTTYDPALKTAIKESSMLFVAAAGNESLNNSKVPTYPASFDLDNIISVASIDGTGALSYFSNYSNKNVDIAAPGENIVSTIIGGYEFSDGTSMATPFVTGIAAMLYSTKDNLYPANVKEVLNQSVKNLSSLNNKTKIPGIYSAYLALLNKDKLISDTTSPTIKLSDNLSESKPSITADVKDSGSGICTIKWLKGNHSYEDFNKGQNGKTLTSSSITVNAYDTEYTFYARDYAGNETIEVIKTGAKPIKPSVSISLNYVKKTLKVGNTLKLKVYLTPKNANTYTFKSSDKKVATVNQAGKITALKKGTAVITVITGTKEKATCTITVK